MHIPYLLILFILLYERLYFLFGICYVPIEDAKG